MSVRIVFTAALCFFSLNFNASAGASDGQPLPPCAGGDVNCAMGVPAAIVEAKVEVTLPPNKSFELTLSEALEIISKVPAPSVAIGDLFGQAQWRSYVTDMGQLLLLAANGGNQPALHTPLTPEQEYKLVRQEINFLKKREKQLSKQLRLKKK